MNAETPGVEARSNEIPGAAARQAAVALLHAVTVLGHPLDIALPRALGKVRRSDDRGLAHALASAALRWLVDLDRLIDSRTARPLPADARARQVLRVALAGALLLQTPAHAAVATALPLVEGGPRRLVHGVLSRLLKDGAALPTLPTLPGHWAERWQGFAEDARAALAEVPPTDLTLRDVARTAEWAERLGGQSFFPGHVRLPGSHAVASLPGYDDGAWWVQDAAAQMPARLLGDVAGLDVLDMCAAPGGKTMQLAAAGARVTALDASEPRMKRLRENLSRTRLEARTVVADAVTWRPAQRFDAVLLDAPCSASGIFRRHPDVLHLKTLAELDRLVDAQRRLLARAAELLKPGGVLVYAVCSLEREEGEGVARQASLAGEPVREEELPDGMAPTADGWVRVTPALWAERGRADGFFMARFRVG